MRERVSQNTLVVIALLTALLLVSLRDLVHPSALPPVAMAWTAFVALASLALLPLIWRGHRWALLAAGVLAALNVVTTSLNPVDPYYLTHWDNPGESLLVVLEGYALPLPLLFFAYRAFRETEGRSPDEIQVR